MTELDARYSGLAVRVYMARSAFPSPAIVRGFGTSRRFHDFGFHRRQPLHIQLVTPRPLLVRQPDARVYPQGSDLGVYGRSRARQARGREGWGHDHSVSSDVPEYAWRPRPL